MTDFSSFSKFAAALDPDGFSWKARRLWWPRKVFGCWRWLSTIECRRWATFFFEGWEYREGKKRERHQNWMFGE